MYRVLIGALVLLFVAACSGSGSTPSSAPRSASSNVTTSTGVYSTDYPWAKLGGPMPPPFREGIDKLEKTTLVSQPIPPNWPHFAPPLPSAQSAMKRGATAFRSVTNDSGYDNGGQAGFTWSSDGDGNLYVAQAAFLGDYFGGSFSLVTPPSGVSYTILDAPTSHAGKNDCIEGVTSYSNGFSWTGSTRGQFQVYDFCSNQYGASYDMDSTFIGKYVRVWTNSGNNIPKYILEETTLKDSDGYFHALIYNANTGAWDDFYDANSGGSSSRTDGWSIFETHYGASGDSNSEACSNVGAISETGLRLHNSSGWYLVGSGDVGSGFTFGNCFGSPYTDYYYGFSYNLSSDSQWTVTTY